MRAAAEEKVPRAGLGPTHWGESFRSGIGVKLLVSVLVLVFVLDLAKKPLIGKSLVDQIFSVLMYIVHIQSIPSCSKHILQITVSQII